MSRRTTGLLTAALLSASPLALSPLPASAAACTAPEVVSASASPRSVVLGAGGTAAFVVSVSVAGNGCDLTGTDAEIILPGKARTVVQQALALESSTDGVTVFAGSVLLDAATLPDSAAGTWKVRTSTGWTGGATPVTTQVDSAEDGDDEDESEDGEDGEDQAVEGQTKVAVLRASSVSADATSSALSKHNRIKKGKAMTVKGVLRQTSWSAGAEQGYAKQRVDLQFRTTDGRYKKVKSLQTRRGGTFVESVKAVKDGCYRVVFRGSKTTAPATSAGECIDVR